MLQGSRATTTKGSFQTRCQIHALGHQPSLVTVGYYASNLKFQRDCRKSGLTDGIGTDGLRAGVVNPPGLTCAALPLTSEGRQRIKR